MEEIERDSKPYKTDEIVLITYPSIIFVKTINNSIIGRPEYDDLINLHSKYYANQDLDSFLYSVLNLELKIPIKYLNELKIKTFTIDNSIENKILKTGIDNIISEISEVRNGKNLLKKNLNFDNRDGTIEYFLYINKLQVIRDDYSALSWIEKKENFVLNNK